MRTDPPRKSAPGSGAPPPPDRPNEPAQLFFMLACQEGYITGMQCSILKGMTGNTMQLDGLLSLIALWNVGAKRLAEMKELAKEIEALSPEAVSARIRDLQGAPPRLIMAVPLELQWFCYLAIRRELLTQEQCVELDAELGHKRDFLGFAQAVVVLLPKEQFPLIQQLVETSMQYANIGKAPPTRIFDVSVGL